MSENENIEAKLCSYIEGDLDAEGRAEIEKYLIAHPQYRPLIAELANTRGLLRGLPRASAPAELLETLSGQIERSALLGDTDHGAMKIGSGRMPHLAAWAAVLLLTGGLAAVIYRVLPSNKSPSEIALLKPAPQIGSATQSLADELQKPSPALDRSVSAQSQPDALAGIRERVPAAADAATAAAIAENEQTAALPTAEPSAEGLATSAPALASAIGVADGTAVSGGTAGANNFALQQPAGSIVSGNATQLGQNMYVTLRATDAKVADARVAQYLNDNGIQFESRSINAGASVSARPLAPLTPSASYGMSGTDAAAAKDLPGAPAFAVAKSRQAMTETDKTDETVMSPARREFNPGAFPTTQAWLGQHDAGDVIIARNLTPDQANRLRNDFAVTLTPATSMSAELKQTSGPISDAIRHASSTAQGALAAGDRVLIVAKDNGLPGVEAMHEPQTIDAEGNLTLPLVGKVKAAGASEFQLSDQISQAYRNAKSQTSVTWMISRIASSSPRTEPTLSFDTPVEAAAPAATTAPVGMSSAIGGRLLAGGTAASTGAGGGGGGFGGGAGEHHGIDVTIQVVGQSGSATAPATQQALRAGGASAPEAVPAMIPVASPAATMPTSAPAP